MADKKITSKDQIIAAIDQGLTIEIDLTEITEPAEREEVAALLAIAKVSASIKQKQHSFLQDAIKPGDHWAHLLIKEKIGSGGFGQVFRAFDTVLQAEVAVKFLNPESQLHIEEDDFLQEARLMATVRNPHVLAIHGAATDKGIAGYWSDYLDGEVLFNRLETGLLSPDKQIEIIEDLIQAVKATHDSGVVHGDIKSLNVMLQPNRGAILLDFGSSRSGLRVIEGAGTVQASPIAMAPEQFEGAVSSQASDVFTLGLLMVEILTGQHPLINKDLAAIKQAITDMPAYLKSQPLKKDWRKLLFQMLAPKPKQRTDIHAVEKQVRQIKNKPVKRAKRIALSATILLLLSVIVLSFYNNWSIRQANKQTDATNDILFDVFLTVSPYPEGKKTKLVDALKKAEQAIISSSVLPAEGKHRLLVRLVGTFLSLSDLDSTLEYADKVLEQPHLSVLNQMHMYDFKARVHLHKRELDQARPYYQKIVDIPTDERKEINQKVNALSYLFYIALQKDEIDQVELIQEQIEDLLPYSEQKPSMLSKIAYNQGLYFDRLQLHENAADSLHQAADYQEQIHHAEHYSVLTYRSVAAQVLATSGEGKLIEQGIEELKGLIVRMDESMGKTHSNTIAAKMNLASAYNRSGQSAAAIEILESIKPEVFEKYGENSLFVLKRYYQNLAGAYERNKRLDDALALLDLQFELFKKHHPDQTILPFRSKLDLTNVLFNHQKFNQSKSLTLDLLGEATDVLGEHHRLVLEIQQFLTIIDFEVSEQPSTKPMQLLLEKHTEILGEEDPLIIEFQDKINDREEQLTMKNTSK